MPRDRGARTKVATGIYRDALGYAVQVCVAGQRRERRYPPGTSTRTLTEAREDLRAELRRGGHRRRATQAGTFAADAARYLEAVAGMPSLASREAIVRRWVGVFGPLQRDHLVATQIRVALSQFQQELSSQTCRHHLRVLRHIFRVLDGPDAPNPADAVPLPAAPPLAPRAIPVLVAARLIHAVGRGSQTRARLAVIATTGMAHSELARLRPEHIDWTHGTVTVLGRRKGHGTRARTLPLTRHSRAALRLLVRREAFGPFSASAMHKSFRLACKACGYGHADWRPYDLRHTFATQLARLTRDTGAVQAWLGHASATTTQRYVLGSIEARVQAGAAALDGK